MRLPGDACHLHNSRGHISPGGVPGDAHLRVTLAFHLPPGAAFRLLPSAWHRPPSPPDKAFFFAPGRHSRCRVGGRIRAHALRVRAILNQTGFWEVATGGIFLLMPTLRRVGGASPRGSLLLPRGPTRVIPRAPACFGALFSISPRRRSALLPETGVGRVLCPAWCPATTHALPTREMALSECSNGHSGDGLEPPPWTFSGQWPIVGVKWLPNPPSQHAGNIR